MLPYGRAICYSGYRKNQSPITKIYPTDDEVLEDLRLLEPHFDYLRMYDPYHHVQSVCRVIEKHHLKLQVMVGVEPRGEISNPNCPWGGLHSEQEIAHNKVFNYTQLDLLAELANRYPTIVNAVAVGNESTSDWHPNLMHPHTMADYVRYLKKKVKQPVTFCEGGHYWREKDEVIQKEVDFVSIHCYPLWQRVPVMEAVQFTIKDYLDTRKRFPDKPIIFTEFGWATSADDKMIPGAANEKNQKIYLEEMIRFSKQNQIIMYIFEAFDEPWKGGNNPFEAEKNWGIFFENRTPKEYMKSLLK